MKRSRGRGRRQQNPVNRSYDSNGPDVRVRGTASQVYEKYQALARDAMSSGDRVMAENYGQHAEHYYRIMLSLQPAPSEADRDADNGDAAHGEVLNGDADAGDTTSESGAEPLVLTREVDAGEEKSGEDKPARSSRRRGPLRKKAADKAETGENGAYEEAASDAAPDATPDAVADAAPITPLTQEGEAVESDAKLTAE